MKVSMKLGKGERLLLMRHRLGLTQPQAAREYKVDRLTLGQWERGEIPEDQIPAIKHFKNVSPIEACLIFRKRKGLLQKDLARTLGVSRYWLGLMEKGEVDPTPILEYWKERTSKKYDSKERLKEPYGRIEI